LAARNLVEIGGDQSLAMHQVVHDAAAAQAPAAAVEKHIAYYLDFVDENPEDWQRIEGVLPQVRQAWRALAEDDSRVIVFVWAMQEFFNRRGLRQDQITWTTRAQQFSQQHNDSKISAQLLTNIGAVYSDLGDKVKALEYYEHALPTLRQVGDRGGEALSLTNIGLVYADLGDKAKALEYYEQALPIRRQVGDRRGEAATLSNIGNVYSDLGDKAKALECYEQALPILRQVGDRFGESITRYNIAMVATELDDLERAETELTIVVALDEAIHHPDLESDRAALARIREQRRQQDASSRT
jgi:tetratricopeptide (TPR) repeat protein